MNGRANQAALRVIGDRESFAEEAARIVADSARQAISSRGMFHLALSGGNTPRPVYEKLAAAPYNDQIDWSRVQVFFSDERFVPPDSSESNFHMANQALLSRVPIPERFVHRVSTVDITPEAAAANEEEGIRRVFAVGLTESPRFDLILLGMGPDGHTASLFPGTEALNVADTLVVANYVPRLDAQRITFTYPLLNAARRVLFLVQGEDKAEMVSRALKGDPEVPAGHVRPEGELIWLLDEAAASRLPRDTARADAWTQAAEGSPVSASARAGESPAPSDAGEPSLAGAAPDIGEPSAAGPTEGRGASSVTTTSGAEDQDASGGAHPVEQET
ncbi:MAG: 6-phosphogluconolactonase [Chloroflexi bacterium]|nr:6-phosphogluconolactonase [Chloroflexota bacterium]